MLPILILQIASDAAKQTPSNVLSVTLDIAAAVSAILWPLLLFILLFVYRKEVPKFIQAIGSKISKVEFAGVSFEFARAKEFVPSWKASPNDPDLRHKATPVELTDHIVASFLTQLQNTGTGDYAEVNLGEGKEWLTTRLYIMSILFDRMKGIKCFVFVESTAATRKRFVCWAEPEKIRWALARRYEWLEPAFANAYSKLLSPPSKMLIVSSQGRIGYDHDPQNPNPGIDLLKDFLSGVQAHAVTIYNNMMAENDPTNWTLIHDINRIYEHGTWIGGALIEDILRGVAHRSTLSTCMLAQDDKGKQMREMLAMTGAFIPVVSENSRFEYLLDRNVLMEQMSRVVSS